MPYMNARDIIPPDLLDSIQEYVDGQLLYIPKKADRRSPWGSKSGCRKLLQQRNTTIRQAYRSGCRLAELADSQHLSEESIRKIIYADEVNSRLSEARENKTR